MGHNRNQKIIIVIGWKKNSHAYDILCVCIRISLTQRFFKWRTDSNLNSTPAVDFSEQTFEHITFFEANVELNEDQMRAPVLISSYLEQILHQMTHKFNAVWSVLPMTSLLILTQREHARGKPVSTQEFVEQGVL